MDALTVQPGHRKNVLSSAEKKSRFTEEQIIEFLRQATDAKRLRELESENAKLKL